MEHPNASSPYRKTHSLFLRVPWDSYRIRWGPRKRKTGQKAYCGKCIAPFLFWFPSAFKSENCLLSLTITFIGRSTRSQSSRVEEKEFQFHASGIFPITSQTFLARLASGLYFRCLSFFLLGGWKTFPGSFFLLSTTFFLGLSNFNAVLFRRGDPGGKLVSVTLRYPDSYNLDLAPSFEAIFVFESHGKFARNVEVN